ncbi:uncharacterized protein CTRU02_205975 [Colletotrichum truncatum]|uniref:Uncharacterized protein n=1 Tax=Colletotrichum truncatum TaxID=5467 RepID=A0ACC3Z5M5_COLTU|nr:uncharacterized protein CTRU02_04809 [Colletotrichum truncatum]KAF6795246.1 hypothetical protein CTRU02_04809 [Colletotrichum truncatum]
MKMLVFHCCQLARMQTIIAFMSDYYDLSGLILGTHFPYSLSFSFVFGHGRSRLAVIRGLQPQVFAFFLLVDSGIGRLRVRECVCVAEDWKR